MGGGPVAEVVAAVRIVAPPSSLDTAVWPGGATAVRVAPDEVLVVDALEVNPPDPEAIVFPDTSWVRHRLSPADGAAVMAGAASWPPPTAGVGQGMVAGVAAKLVVGPEEWWLLVQGVVAAEFGARIDAVLSAVEGGV